MSDKKKEQLGMSYGTASGRLVKDIIWNFIEKSGENCCFHCGEPMDRDSFSIEHKSPWLDSEDPVGLFFSLENISFSHKSCNYSAARRPTKGMGKLPEEFEHGTWSRYAGGCRCDVCASYNRMRVNRTRNLRPNRR